ncbi:MAG: inorganic diphosphatase [Rhizobiales bacterium]|nr:inorganic diphosphatase [Hyphomicrobiales bacterium]
MDLSGISVGRNPPHDIHAVIEIPLGGVPVKYEIDKASGALVMEDEAGGDEKILAVPVDALHPFYTGVKSYRDLPPIMCEQIAHFFQHYKDLEKGKWVTIVQWLDADGAARLVTEAIARAAAEPRA